MNNVGYKKRHMQFKSIWHFCCFLYINLRKIAPFFYAEIPEQKTRTREKRSICKRIEEKHGYILKKIPKTS